MKIKTIIILIIISLKISNVYSQERDLNHIFKNLRCLICQGQSIADSNSEFAQTIKSVVNDKIDEGKSEEEIYNFLREKYGNWILYKPPLNLTNSILWIFPYIALFFGGFLIFLVIKKESNK